MDINVKNIIGGKRYKQAVNTNTNIQLQLESKNKPLIEYDVNSVVNLQDVFNEERESSNKYRFNGKLNIFTTNVLSTGATSSVWDPLFYGTPPVAPNNWVMQMTYPSNMDSEYPITFRTIGGTSYTSEAFRGMQYEKLGITLIDGVNYLTIIGVQKHNLKIGDTIYLYSYLTNNSLTGIYSIRNLGIDDLDTDKNLTLDIIVDPLTVPSGSGNFVKIYDASFDDIKYANPSNFINYTPTDFSGGTLDYNYTKITTTQPHNLVINDFIDIRSGGLFNGVWRVYNVIDKTNFIIKLTSSTSKGTVFNIFPLPFWQKLDGTPSEYYIRYFEVITSNQYEVYPCSFSTNIYSNNLNYVGDDTWLFQFNQDINITRLVDNRNGPISNIYYTITKRAGKNPYGWSNVTADWDFNYQTTNTLNRIEDISNYNPSGIGSIEKYSARTETIDSTGQIQAIPGSKYIGDFVDYNSKEVREVTIAEVIHRFTDISKGGNPNGNGYYYKPFKKLELKVYSSNIETAVSGETVINIPGNYVTYADGSIAWRDLLTIGYYEEGKNGVYYPFLNGFNYFYFNHNLFIRLQQPVNPLMSFERYVELFVEQC